VGANYGFIPFLVFLYLVIRIWFLYGPKIPLIFIGLLILGGFTVPEALGPYRYSLLVCVLAIVLALIDRFKSVRWNVM
jgi:hypothetical protein